MSLISCTGAVACLLPFAIANTVHAQIVSPPRAVIVRDAEVAQPGPPPHRGAGASVGFPLSARGGLTRLYFAKRVLRRGASIGRHVADSEEVYYIVRGEGELIDDDGRRIVLPQSAITMRSGEVIELRQRGKRNLELLVAKVRK